MKLSTLYRQVSLPVGLMIAAIIVSACRTPETLPTPTATARAVNVQAITIVPTATTAPANLPSPTPTLSVEITQPTATAVPVEVRGPSYDPTMLYLVARINEWRVSEELWPLRINPQLQEIARQQAKYLAGLEFIPTGSDIHLDAAGNDPFARGRLSGWQWYNNDQQIAIGENGYVGATTAKAIEYWQGSDIHTRTATHTAYREIGAAVYPYQQGYNVYIVVFGSQPNDLPALYDPAEGNLYLTTEQYRWSTGGSWIHNVTGVEISLADAPSGNWSAWQVSMPYAADGTPFNVFYSDADNHQTSVTVDPVMDIAWFPANLIYNLQYPVSEASQLTPTPMPVDGADRR